MSQFEEAVAQMKSSSHVEIHSERSKAIALTEEMKALQKKHEGDRQLLLAQVDGLEKKVKLCNGTHRKLLKERETRIAELVADLEKASERATKAERANREMRAKAEGPLSGTSEQRRAGDAALKASRTAEGNRPQSAIGGVRALNSSRGAVRRRAKVSPRGVNSSKSGMNDSKQSSQTLESSAKKRPGVSASKRSEVSRFSQHSVEGKKPAHGRKRSRSASESKGGKRSGRKERRVRQPILMMNDLSALSNNGNNVSLCFLNLSLRSIFTRRIVARAGASRVRG